MDSKKITLRAPLSGYILELAKVPDPVFSSKMAGDGISIDPTSNTLIAPCDGKVLHIHPSSHALTLEAQGLEILMHIGLDTVALKGQGFKPLVKIGDSVKTGDPLIEFDIDYVAKHAKSLMTQVLISNPETCEKIQPAKGNAEAGQTAAMIITLGEAAEQSSQQGNVLSSELISIANPQGLHARPAAVLANIAKRFKADCRIICGDKSANCKSVTGIMAMQIACNAQIRLTAMGAEAEEAIKAMQEAVISGLGEGVSSLPSSSVQAAQDVPSPSEARNLPEGCLGGLSASPGVAVGKVFQMCAPEYEIEEKGGDLKTERRIFDRAIEQAKSELEFIESNMRSQHDPSKAVIFAAHRELLDDPELTEGTMEGISLGQSAAFAWKATFTEQAKRLSELNNPLMAARAADIKDIGDRVLRLITGKAPTVPEMPEDAILIAEELVPSEAATLDRSKVMGFATVLGGTTSHVAILARSLDLPAVTGIDTRALNLPNGTPVILNGTEGILNTKPTEEEISRARAALQRQKERREEFLAKADIPATTLDGHHVEVVANAASVADIEQAMIMGAEGIGLLRSEFLFNGRTQEPSEEEQQEVYADAIKAVGKGRLIIRTMDIGGDKPLPYIPMPKEDNPFLGERGIRLALRRSDLLRTQFRAILKAAASSDSPGTNVMVMLPMVMELDEFRKAKAIYEEERQAIGAPAVPLGVMIEVPSAAITAEIMAQEAEFFSIGTNDLTQYTLAIDRGHPKIANRADGLHPAVFRLIKATTDGAECYGRMTGVCGGIASDALAVPILLGLGVDELSIPAPAIPAIKDLIRHLSLEKCRELAASALGFSSALEVRQMMRDYLHSIIPLEK